MKLHIEFEPSDIQAVKTVIQQYPAEWRYKENVVGEPPEIDDDALWITHMRCLLTTQQRSGKGSSISAFLHSNPFPLALDSCRQSGDLLATAFQLLTDAKGIRRTNKIANAVYKNLAMLEHGEWTRLYQWRDKLLEQRKTAYHPSHRVLEEEAADYMDQFSEFGPKQSRNFWQLLGLTRYVFVLDSRVISWSRQHLKFAKGLLTSRGLSDRDYYCFISDILFKLCDEANVLPCMFDGAVFSSFEK